MWKIEGAFLMWGKSADRLAVGLVVITGDWKHEKKAENFRNRIRAFGAARQHGGDQKRNDFYLQHSIKIRKTEKMRIVTVVPAPIPHLPVIPSVVPAGNSENIIRKNRI